jgi:A-kinase anchor protein 9
MEAQRICLPLVYSTHVDQVREYMENEKDKALCSLKEELISAQEEKIKELKKIHQLELQNMKTEEAGKWVLTCKYCEVVPLRTYHFIILSFFENP